MLRALLQDEDSTTRVNIKPHNMGLCLLLLLCPQRLPAACVSPRVFWNIVRHCKVGPSTSFEAAFASLVPDEKWDVILSRNQVRTRCEGAAGERGAGGASGRQVSLLVEECYQGKHP